MLPICLLCNPSCSVETSLCHCLSPFCFVAAFTWILRAHYDVVSHVHDVQSVQGLRTPTWTQILILLLRPEATEANNLARYQSGNVYEENAKAKWQKEKHDATGSVNSFIRPIIGWQSYIDISLAFISETISKHIPTLEIWALRIFSGCEYELVLWTW